MMVLTDWNPLLVTKRLRLEPQVEAHTDALMQALESPRTHEFVPSDPPTDREKIADRMKKLESRISPDGLQHWLNWTVFSGFEVIGTVQADATDSSSSASIAYMFHPNSWGKGFAFEATTAMLKHLKSQGITSFKAWTDTRNLASHKLLERLGFSETEEIKNADEFKGSVSHEFVYTFKLEGK
jgi:[ribosomal protein S5]-alanine N-acetyltransferase